MYTWSGEEHLIPFYVNTSKTLVVPFSTTCVHLNGFSFFLFILFFSVYIEVIEKIRLNQAIRIPEPIRWKALSSLLSLCRESQIDWVTGSKTGLQARQMALKLQQGHYRSPPHGQSRQCFQSRGWTAQNRHDLCQRSQRLPRFCDGPVPHFFGCPRSSVPRNGSLARCTNIPISAWKILEAWDTGAIAGGTCPATSEAGRFSWCSGCFESPFRCSSISFMSNIHTIK